MTAVVSYLRGPWAIAIYTWREGMRKRILLGFLILSLLFIFGANLMAAFMAESAVGNVESDIDVKLIKDICVTIISIFGVLITIFVSASVIPTETENKVVYTILSKPVRRFQYLMGKFIGVQLIVIINLLLMGALFFIAIYVKQRVLPTLLLWSILLTYFEFLVVSAFTFAVGCGSTSAVLPTIAGLFIYLTGHLTEHLKDVGRRAGQTGIFLDDLIGKIANGLYLVLPNLQLFSLKSQILYLKPNAPPVDLQIFNVAAYALLYAGSGFIMAYWIFRRREL